MMESLVLSGIFPWLFNLFIGLFVFFKNPQKKTNQVFCLFSVCVAFWSVGSFLVQVFGDSITSIYITKVCYSFGVFLPPLFYTFVRALIEPKKSLNTISAVQYGISIFLFLIIWATPFFIGGLRELKPANYLVVKPGPVYVIYLIFFCLCIFFALYVLQKRARIEKGVFKSRLFFVFASYLIASVSGLEYFATVLGFVNHPPLDDYILVVSFLMMSYAILKLHLMDIEVIVKKTLVFTSLFAMTMSIVALVSGVTQEILGDLLDGRTGWSIALSGLIVISIYEPTKKFLIALTDRFLFQKTQDFRQILTDLSHTIIAVLDIDKIGGIILHTFENALHLESGAILLKTEDWKAYKILDAFGLDKKHEPIEGNNPLVSYFSDSDKVVNLDLEDDVPDFVKKTMADLRARVMVPLFSQGVLIGILALGKKKSDQEYTRQEMEYFPAISAQIAVALSNARSIALLKKQQIEMAQQSKLASLGTLSAGIAHEIYNPVNQIGMAVGMMRMNKEFNKDLPREGYEALVFDTLSRIEGDTKRIINITERLSAFARKRNETRKETVDLRDALENVLLILQGEFKSHDIKLDRRLAEQPLKAKADLHAMEEIFLNLLVNARHAINKNGTITIESQIRESEIELSISDTGGGIPEDILANIFDPFFTTKDTTRSSEPGTIKGSGLGLHLVREIVQQHDGRITVESKLGKGTTFRIFLPTQLLNAKT